MANKRQRRTALRNFLGEGDLYKGRRLNFVTTSGGVASGTTLVSTEVSGFYDLDDGLIGAYIAIDEGSAIGEESLIIDYTASSGTITVKPPFSSQIDTAISALLFERGKYSDLELENSLQQAEYKVAQTLDPNSLFFLQKTFECSVVNGVIRRDTLLSDMISLIAITDISRNVIFRILPVTSLQKLKDSKDPDFATTDRPAAVQAGTPANDRFGDYWILPSDIATVEAIYIKSPTDLTATDATETSTSDIDDRFERLVILYAAFITTGEDRFLQEYMVNVQVLRGDIDTPLIGYEGAQPQSQEPSR